MMQKLIDEAETDYDLWCKDGKDKNYFLGGVSSDIIQKIMRNDEKTPDSKMHSSGLP